MVRMSWSNQRPQRLALHKNDQAVEVWKKDARPEIKKIRELNATLALEDDAGFSMVSPVKRTWSQQGQTPVFRASLNHHERLNLFGVLLVSPKARKIYLSVKSYWDTLTGDKVITFLKQILHLVHRHIVLV